ncbi:MAG: hypothetical protein H0V17_08875, partial [Deltaproteobacteria bacterium]|nr:hypothetical protein [Deltaproteobacteria bacterium]
MKPAGLDQPMAPPKMADGTLEPVVAAASVAFDNTVAPSLDETVPPRRAELNLDSAAAAVRVGLEATMAAAPARDTSFDNTMAAEVALQNTVAGGPSVARKTVAEDPTLAGGPSQVRPSRSR